MAQEIASAEEIARRNDELIDKNLIRQWLLWGFFWLLFAPLVGVIASTKFNYPDFLGASPFLTFGRIRPIHVNGVIFGTFSTLFIGLCYYLLPRLAGVRVYKEQWGYPFLWLWNLTLAAGFVSLAMGYNQGLEAAEFPLLIDILLWVALLGITVQFLVTVARRQEPRIYVSLWYLVAAFIWTDINWVLGNFIIPYSIPGINNAALHGLYIHYVVGLWITPAGYVLIYYFLPASVRNPIYSHKLSLIGFWSLAFFYPFVGIHHYLFSPIADWAETIAIITSMLLIVPVWTVLQNFFGTMIGCWQFFSRNLTAKFLITGSLMYLIGCLQGSTEALRAMQEPTHFYGFRHLPSHLTVFGTFVMWTVGRHDLRLAPGHRRRIMELSPWKLVVLVDYSGDYLHGIDFDRAGIATGLHADVAGRVGRFAGVHETVLVVQDLLGNFHGRRSGPVTHQPGVVDAVPPGAGRGLAGNRLETRAHGSSCGWLWIYYPGRFCARHPPGPDPRIARRSGHHGGAHGVGELKWLWHQAQDYTELERLGRQVYIREGCWYCHSQYVRPVTGEDQRWGFVSQAGEYAYDLPHLLQHPAHWPGPHPGRPQVRGRLALRASLGPEAGGA